MRSPAFALLLLTSTAAAAEVDEPGRAAQTPGTVVLSDVNRASASFFVHNNELGMRGQRVVLAPTVDVFASRHLTLGAALGLAYEHTSVAHSLELGGDGRLGVYGVLAKNWALWPTLAVGAYRYTTTFPDDGPRVVLRARLDLPVLYYPAPGFFVGAGPHVGAAAQPSENHGFTVTFGVTTTLGGTF